MEDVYSVLFCSLVKTEYREILCAQLDREKEMATEAGTNVRRQTTSLKKKLTNTASHLKVLPAVEDPAEDMLSEIG